MKPLTKYALTLAGIGFAVMTFPGAVSVACGFPMLFASFGLALSVILFSKGIIAEKIFKHDNYRQAAYGWGTIILALTLFRAYAVISEMIAYRRLFGDYLEADPEYMAGQYTAVLTASVFYSALVYACVVIRNYFRNRNAVKQTTA